MQYGLPFYIQLNGSQHLNAHHLLRRRMPMVYQLLDTDGPSTRRS